MSIKLRHLRYAFMRTAWIPLIFALLIAVLAIRDRRTIEDIAWASIPGLVVWLVCFAYWLRRTQKKTADNPRPGEWS